MPQIVQEPIPKPLPQMRPRHEPGHVQELDGHATAPGDAGAVIGCASGLQGEAGAGAGDLQVADGALGVDGCEA